MAEELGTPPTSRGAGRFPRIEPWAPSHPSHTLRGRGGGKPGEGPGCISQIPALEKGAWATGQLPGSMWEHAGPEAP